MKGRGVGFRSLTEAIDTYTPTGRLMGHITGALAEFERSSIIERTRAGINAAKRRGVRVWRKPKLTAQHVAHARQLINGGESPSNVARLLGVGRSTIYRASLNRAYRDYIKGSPHRWTCSPRTERSDLLFVYFIAPRKAIHFVARAESKPFVDDSSVNANHAVSSHQWWVNHTPFVAIEPISYRQLSAAMGETVNLKGRSGKYIPSDAANTLVRSARVTYSSSPGLTRQTFRPVVGRAELPIPGKMSLKEWREIPASLLRIEKEVERYVVEPLLRFCGLARAGLTVKRQFRVRRRLADYVVLSHGTPICVVEVKQRVQCPIHGAAWVLSPDYQQLSDYAGYLRYLGVLVDCDEVLLFARKGGQLLHRFERRTLTLRELGFIAEHLGVSYRRSGTIS